MRNLSMKKFGTPIRAGPGMASEKVGFEGAGEPSGLLSFGAGTTVGGSVVGGAVEQSRPEVEVEGLPLLQARVEPVRPPCTLVCTPASAPACEVLPAPWPAWPGVAVACG